MQISIIIPIYEVEPYIERCIKSVISQTFTDYEVVLVDDKSPDNALQIAEKLLQENKIAFQTIRHAKNKGLSEARNSGQKAAKGKYIMFIDSDDDLPDKKVLGLFYDTTEREKVDFVCANYSGIYGKNDIRRGEYIVGINTEKRLQNEDVFSAVLYTEISVLACNKLFNRAFLLTHNLWFQKDLMHEDELWMFQVALKANSCYCLPNYTYNYYKNTPNSITKNANEKSYEDKITILKKQLHIINKHELLKKISPNTFIFHFKRISQEILRPKLLSNKNLWRGYYKKIKHLYRQSELYQYKKLFRLPAPIAYSVRKEKHKNRLNNGNRYYGKFLRKVDKYNWG